MKHNTTRPVTRLNVSVLLVVDENASVAHASVGHFDVTGQEMLYAESTGSAKREPGDPGDDGIAAHLAMGRALVNLGRSLLATGRTAVELSVTDQQEASRAAVERRLRRSVQMPRHLLPADEILERYGAEAAARAQARRQPHGRHRKEQKG